MDHNPYTPPGSEVADSAPAAPPTPPRNVKIALALTGGALLIQILMKLWFLQQAGFRIFSPLSLGGSLFWYLVGAVLLMLLARGRSWARIVLLIATLGTFVTTCYGVGIVLKDDALYRDLFFSAWFLFYRLLPMSMNFAALHLLYFSSGSWFRER